MVFGIGFPQKVRLDRGTENTLIAQCQVALAMCHEDDQESARSVQYGSSPANSVSVVHMYNIHWYMTLCIQRIESWWSRLCKHKTDWWIEYFRVSNTALYTRLPLKAFADVGA